MVFAWAKFSVRSQIIQPLHLHKRIASAMLVSFVAPNAKATSWPLGIGLIVVTFDARIRRRSEVPHRYVTALQNSFHSLALWPGRAKVGSYQNHFNSGKAL